MNVPSCLLDQGPGFCFKTGINRGVTKTRVVFGGSRRREVGPVELWCLLCRESWTQKPKFPYFGRVNSSVQNSCFPQTIGDSAVSKV